MKPNTVKCQSCGKRKAVVFCISRVFQPNFIRSILACLKCSESLMKECEKEGFASLYWVEKL